MSTPGNTVEDLSQTPTHGDYFTNKARLAREITALKAEAVLHRRMKRIGNNIYSQGEMTVDNFEYGELMYAKEQLDEIERRCPGLAFSVLNNNDNDFVQHYKMLTYYKRAFNQLSAEVNAMIKRFNARLDVLTGNSDSD